VRPLILGVLSCCCAFAGVDRVVIIKVDGLPERYIEQYTSQAAEGRRAGHSRLPWIEHVFVKNGTWLQDFYVRGISLSSPSWSMLDTGRHLEVRGNAEWDRYTMRVEDYMNFFPLYLRYAHGQQADMPGVELLDENSVPLLLDRFPYEARSQSFQLYQRGVRWKTLEGALQRDFTGRSPRQLFDEWETGLSLGQGLGIEEERVLEQKLQDPSIRYLDLFIGDFDHTAHLTADPVTIEHVLESLDALVGRIWTAIAASPLASTTALVMVSDHGMNMDPKIYSQGYDLLAWLNSAEGGAHHVMMNRHPMTEFKIRGLDPLVSEVITPSQESTYLNGESARYPTAVVDADGNERASIGLRNNSLNVIHILLDQLIRKKVSGPLRRAAIDALFQTLDRVRPVWTKNVNGLSNELVALRARIAAQQAIVDALPKKFPPEDHQNGVTVDAKRQIRRLDLMKADEKGYSAYVTVMQNLLSLDPADFDPGKFNTEDLIPRRSLGEPNSLYDLQNYVAGPSNHGLALAANGSLDFDRSFRKVDYLSALGAITARNNVQRDVGPKPVDFIAVPLTNAVWLRASADRQALIEVRHSTTGALELHYVPVANLTQDSSGQLHYDRAAWAAGFPLAIFEDPMLNVEGDRAVWLDQWHTDQEWLNAVHRTVYSNGVIGIVEALLRDPVADPYLERKRELRGFDMIAFASDHWNFNVRSFNPGGNHGSFLRVSTHSVLMFAGGEETGIPRDLRVSAPYDSLSLVPTILKLMNRPEPSLPGRPIQEIVR
jgi:hypothetical protein